MFVDLRCGAFARPSVALHQGQAALAVPTASTMGPPRKTLIVLMIAALFVAKARAGAPEIGDTVVVKNEVTVEAGNVSRTIEKGSKVFQDEIVVTNTSASAEFELLDQTKLAVGPSARVVLDKFVSDASAGSISVGMVKGAFRFITGSSPKTAYKIHIPAATIGVRGTVFDVYVADDGETVILLHEGSVDVCPTPTTCQHHDRICHIVRIGPDGAVSLPARWDGGILNGISVAQAFPFVGRKLAIDPVRRLSYPALIAGTCDFAQNKPSPTLRPAAAKPFATGPAAGVTALGFAPLIAPLIFRPPTNLRAAIEPLTYDF